MDRYLLVMLGAGLGGLTRYLVGSAVMARVDGRFPLGTLVINVTGCFLIGILMTIFQSRPDVHPNWQLLLVVGGLGGYTTFSSFGWEAYRSIRDGHAGMGLAYVLLSVGLGYVAVWLGAMMARR